MSVGLDAAQEFTITHQARPNCLLMRSYFQDNKFLTYASAYATTFKVMKTENKLTSGEKQVIFFAIHGPSVFTKATTKGFSKSHKYVGQLVGYSVSMESLKELKLTIHLEMHADAELLLF